MKIKLLALVLLTLVLTACQEVEHKGPIPLPEKQEGKTGQLMYEQSGITNIFVEYQNKFDVGKAQLDFEPRGIIDGIASPLIPLGKTSSQLEALGFTTHISIDGEEATLEYNKNYLRFKVGVKTLFLNNDEALQMADAPIYNNTTIYVPFIPILDVLKIDYRIEGTDIIVGGMYTDDSGKPYTSTEVTGESGN